jgi:hypothetical protein
MAKRKKVDPDSMLVKHTHIMDARTRISEQGHQAALEALLDREPALAAYMSQAMATIAGKMALAGAPTEVVQGVHADVLLVMLSSLEASRAAEYELWEGTLLGTRLEALAKQEPEPEPVVDILPDPVVDEKPAPKAKAPRKPRKRKKPDSES